MFLDTISDTLNCFVMEYTIFEVENITQSEVVDRLWHLGGNVAMPGALRGQRAAPSDVGTGDASRQYGAFAFVSKLFDAPKC